MRGIFREEPARSLGVEVHRVRRGVNNEYAGATGLLEERLHLFGNQTNPVGCALAPMAVPHIGDDDGCLRARCSRQNGLLPRDRWRGRVWIQVRSRSWISACPDPAVSDAEMVGAQYFSMCSITSSVPAAWDTNGRDAGLYIASVRSRTKTQRSPHLDIWRTPKGRFRMHMLACTPM